MSKKYPNYEDYAIKKFVNDLDDLVKYLQIKKFILITNSFGGIIGLKIYKEDTKKLSCKYNDFIGNIFKRRNLWEK